VLDLRPARLDDPDARVLTEEVQGYYVEIYGGTDDDPIEPEEFLPPHGGFLVGYDGDEPVAMGGWSFLPGSSTRAKVRRMFVRPEARRRGYAAAVLDRLEQEARDAGAAQMVLTTGEPQAAAVRFYRSRGYADVEPFGFYADAPTSVHLGKTL
jgi:GNAT superfamily N-acetyltransferase